MRRQQVTNPACAASGHILMDSRHGLVVDVEITHASGTAEREAALKMLVRQKRKRRQLTVGGLAKI
jgi:xanthine/CO dehydrogenase XdhC/CoxF family maturation factor